MHSAQCSRLTQSCDVALAVAMEQGAACGVPIACRQLPSVLAGLSQHFFSMLCIDYRGCGVPIAAERFHACGRSVASSGTLTEEFSKRQIALIPESRQSRYYMPVAGIAQTSCAWSACKQYDVCSVYPDAATRVHCAKPDTGGTDLQQCQPGKILPVLGQSDAKISASSPYDEVGCFDFCGVAVTSRRSHARALLPCGPPMSAGDMQRSSCDYSCMQAPTSV